MGLYVRHRKHRLRYRQAQIKKTSNLSNPQFRNSILPSSNHIPPTLYSAIHPSILPSLQSVCPTICVHPFIASFLHLSLYPSIPFVQCDAIKAKIKNKDYLSMYQRYKMLLQYQTQVRVREMSLTTERRARGSNQQLKTRTNIRQTSKKKCTQISFLGPYDRQTSTDGQEGSQESQSSNNCQ